MCPPRPASSDPRADEHALWAAAAAHLDDVLAGIRAPDLDRPTPCARWRVGDLLAHLDDGLQALAEGAVGGITPRATPPATAVTPRRVRATLAVAVARWQRLPPASPAAPASRVDRWPVPPWLLLTVGALEATVHAWDLARAVGSDAAIPVELALPLRPAAELLTGWSGHRGDPDDAFAAPLPVPPGASAEERLLGVVGRRWSRPVDTGSPIPGTRPIGSS
ncbi:TIGR03086 family metal-binding protein [Nocardioides sp.]|uniref:TIGR03086 family metal-binding protein n=1 Tax=Nocardioides sp. TaxID=35761 RepID=UPI003514A039